MPTRSKDPIKRGARRAKTQRRVGQDAACTRCTERRPEMLVRSSRPKLCLTCCASKNGKRVTERHHLAGKANSPVAVEIPVSDHRTLSEAQYEWPARTLRNPDGSPLRAIAGSLRGVADFVGDLVVAFIQRLAEFAEEIDTWLCERYGLWWKGGPFDRWQPQ